MPSQHSLIHSCQGQQMIESTLNCLAGENKAVVVGNAQPELVEWLLQQPQDDRLIYTSAHLAQGVLEGIARHGLY